MSQDVQDLEQRAAELRRVIDAHSEKEKAVHMLSMIEREISERKEAEHRAAGEERIEAIRAELTTVNVSMDDRVARIAELVAALDGEIEGLNADFRRSMSGRVEAMALADRFNLRVPSLPTAPVPARRGIVTRPATALLDHVHVKPATERCEYAIRERRTYREVAATEGYRIISEAGLKPFPELTDQQRRVLAERERDAEETRKQFAGIKTDHLKSVPGNLSGGFA